MNDDRLYQRLAEAGWRRPLTEAETAALQDWLAAHPEARADWETETALTQALGGLPPAPVPSNFTARVLQAVEREEAAAARRPAPTRWQFLHRWLPRVAFAMFLVGAGLFSHYRVLEVRQQRLVKGIVVVSDVAALPSPKILADFDAIQALGRVPPPDGELLALMTQE